MVLGRTRSRGNLEAGPCSVLEQQKLGLNRGMLRAGRARALRLYTNCFHFFSTSKNVIKTEA